MIPHAPLTRIVSDRTEKSTYAITHNPGSKNVMRTLLSRCDKLRSPEPPPIGLLIATLARKRSTVGERKSIFKVRSERRSKYLSDECCWKAE